MKDKNYGGNKLTRANKSRPLCPGRVRWVYRREHRAMELDIKPRNPGWWQYRLKDHRVEFESSLW